MQEILSRLPKSWSDINYTAYIELKELESEIQDCQTELFFEQLAVLLDTDSLDPLIDNLSMDELFTIMDKCRWLSVTPRPILQKTIGSYTLKPLNELTTGEFIDIEHYIIEGYTTGSMVAAILYKQTRTNDWGHTVWEPHEYDLHKRAQEFEGMSIGAMYGFYEEYAQWKADFMIKYAPLFDDTTEEPPSDLEELEGVERIEALKAEAIEKGRQRWSWEHTLWNLTNGDVTKFDGVFSANVVLVFNTLSMRKVLEV